MKYVIKNENSDIEFADTGSAQTYASSIGYPLDNIIEIPDESVQPDSASSVEVFEQKIAAGYPIPNTPYSLALKDSDRAQFSAMLILVRELLDAGHITDQTPQSIKDKDDNIVTLTTAEFRTLMIGYGIYYKTIWDECEPKS